MLIISKEQLLLLVTVLIIAFVIRTAYKIIKWLFRTIISIFTGRRKYDNPINSDDWLIRSRAKQEIRFDNASPPLLPKAKPQRKTLRQKWNLKHGRSENGWTFNEETQLWEPPKNIK